MNIHRTPLDRLKWEDVVEFCAQQIAENTVLDYKREMPADIEKTIAAMANTLGGLILIGVAEDGYAKPAEFVGIAASRGLAEQVMSKCVSNITPLVVPEIAECLNSAGDRMVIAIRVAQSLDAPHAINRNTLVYVRTGRQSDPEALASIDRLDWILRRRQRLEEFRRSLIERAASRYKLLRSGRVPDIQASREQDAAKCLLTLSICPSYPSQEPLLRAPDLMQVKRGIYVRDPIGTAREFPIDQGVAARSVEDGIIMHIPGGNGLRTYHTHLNIYGLYFFKQSLLWTPNVGQELAESSQPAMRLVEIVARLYSLLLSADRFYKEVGYNGPLHIQLRLENFEGIALLVSNLVDADFSRRHSADRLIDAETTTITYSLLQDRTQIVLALVQRVAWAFDYDLSVEQLESYASKSWLVSL